MPEQPQETPNETPTAWTPELSMKVRDLGAVRVSPNGTQVVYTVTETVMTEEKSEYVTQIYRAQSDGSGSHPLTFGEKSSGNPQWSPDGKVIAFTSNRAGKDNKNNLFLLRTDGGEAEQLTDVKSGVGDFCWSPDSTQIAFLMSDSKTEEEEKRDKAKDDWRWIDEDIKQTHLYLLTLAKDADGKREPRKLTAGDYSVGGGFGAGIDWSPDGKSIVFCHTKTPLADHWPSADVSVLEIATGTVAPLATTPAAEFQPLYSPDGKWIALVISDIPPRWAFHSVLHLLPATGGTPRPLSPTFDGQPALVGWSADSRALYFTEARGTASVLSRMEIETGEITDIDPQSGLFSEFHLNATRTHLSFSFQSVDQAKEAFVTSVESFAPKQVSRVNTDLPALPLGRTEILRWNSADGLEIEGLLTYPTNYEPGKRVPLLLVIHGGPAGVFQESYTAQASLYPTAIFAAQGYAVLRANPRGSSGYGKEFRFANEKDWGIGDYNDLMAGVDHVIALGIADPDKMGVMGWSYGGFMTSWVITHTERFQAASVGAAVTNLVSFTGTADIPGFIPDYFGTQFWEDLEPYRAHSPMFHAGNAKTPSLIQHCEGDLRVPISQGYELYNALKQQGVPVRMLVMPRQDHGPREPRMVLKIMQTNLEWFEKYLKSLPKA